MAVVGFVVVILVVIDATSMCEPLKISTEIGAKQLRFQTLTQRGHFGFFEYSSVIRALPFLITGTVAAKTGCLVALITT